jgi:hypothetical protein
MAFEQNWRSSFQFCWNWSHKHCLIFSLIHLSFIKFWEFHNVNEKTESVIYVILILAMNFIISWSVHFFENERKTYIKKNLYRRPNILCFKEIMSQYSIQYLYSHHHIHRYRESLEHIYYIYNLYKQFISIFI